MEDKSLFTRYEHERKYKGVKDEVINYYLRLNISNTGLDIAKNASIIVSSILEVDQTTGKEKAKENFFPDSLSWTHEDKGVKEIIYRDPINNYVDFLIFSSEVKNKLIVKTTKNPRNSANFLDAGKMYRITLLLVADNIEETINCKLDILWNGSWVDDPFKLLESIKITKIS